MTQYNPKDGSQFIPYEARSGNESIVYFTRDLSAKGLQKAYEQVNGNITGKVGLKLHTGEPHGPNIIPRSWVKELREAEPELKDSSIVETNTYYDGDRYTTQQHRKTLVQIFVEERIYKRIEKCTTAEAVRAEILKGFKPFADRLVRPISDDDVDMLLAVPIRRISLFDINKNREEIEGILKELEQVRKDLKGLRRYTVRYLENLIKKYEFHDVEVEVEPEARPAKKGARDAAARPAKAKKRKFRTVTVPRFPRLTTVEAFETIDVRAVTATKLDICYDPETGFLGPSMRGFEPLFTCSSTDKLLLVWGDGRYKVVPAPEKDKVFVDKDLLLATVFDREKLYTCVYTEKEVPFSCIKRFAFGGVIQNRDYSLLPEPGTIRLLEEGTPPTIWIKFRPAKGQRILQKKFDPSQEVAVKGVRARGKQITTKPISAIAGGDKPPRFWDDSLATEKGGLF